MNDINPNNYDGVTIGALVGRAGGAPQRKDFPGGGSITELSIAVSQGYKKGDEWVDTGTTWYTLTATADWASDNWPDVQKGDKVRVENARQETREYKRKDETTGLQITLKFGDLTIVEAKADREPAAASAGGFGGSSDTPW